MLTTRLRPTAITAIWLTGGLLALLAYAVGPDRFVYRVLDALDILQAEVAAFVLNLELASFDLLRAVAIGLFIVFVLLAGMAIRRGLRGRTALIVVSCAYLFAIGSSATRTGWTMAFLLALAGAASMTGRLMRAAPPVRSGPR